MKTNDLRNLADQYVALQRQIAPPSKQAAQIKKTLVSDASLLDQPTLDLGSVVIDRLDPASVLEYVDGKPWRKFYRHGGQGWYGHLCGYALENGEERNFRHVIWNHPKRVSSFNTFWGRLQ